MTQKIRNRGSVGRYFAKYKRSEFYDKVFEINKQSFKKETHSKPANFFGPA